MKHPLSGLTPSTVSLLRRLRREDARVELAFDGRKRGSARLFYGAREVMTLRLKDVNQIWDRNLILAGVKGTQRIRPRKDGSWTPLRLHLTDEGRAAIRGVTSADYSKLGIAA